MDIKSILRRNRIYLVINVICTTVIQLCVVYGTGLIAKQLDVLISGDRVDVVKLLIFVIPAIVCSVALSWIGGKCVGIYSSIIVKESQDNIINRVLYAKQKFFIEESKGMLLSKLTTDIGELEKYTSITLPKFFTAIVSIAMVAIYVAANNIAMLIIPVILYPILIVIMNYWGNILKKLAQKRRGNYDDLVDNVTDGIDGIEIVKTYNLYNRIVEKVEDSINVILENEYKRAWIMHLSQTISRLLFCIPNMICPAFAFYMTLNGKITIGEMTTYIVLINKIIQSMRELPFYIGDIKEKKVSIERLNQIMNADVVDKSNYLCNENGNINVKNLGFGYNNDKKILKSIDMNIPFGKTVAIVGMSGQGKSTLVKLLAGLEDDFTGQCEITKKRAIVPQKPILFEGTILENIAIGKEKTTKEEAIEAAKLVGIHDKIMNLKDGYETNIGENGAGLSGGERQRLCVARALVADADSILLDEPTSAVDENTEKIIMHTLELLKGHKTVVFISHRLHLSSGADSIIVLDKGRVAQQGTHDELMEMNGIYKQLWDKEEYIEA